MQIHVGTCISELKYTCTIQQPIIHMYMYMCIFIHTCLKQMTSMAPIAFSNCFCILWEDTRTDYCTRERNG